MVSLRTMSIRLDPTLYDKLGRLAASRNLSRNQVVESALELFLALDLDGATHERSWRRGEATGLASAAESCLHRAKFLEGSGASGTQELRWAHQTLDRDGEAVKDMAERIAPAAVLAQTRKAKRT